MKLQGLPRTINSDLTDMAKRVRRLEAVPGGEAGGVDHRDDPYIILPLIEGGWNSFSNDFWHLEMDTAQLYGGWFENGGALGQNIQWDVWLPAMRPFRFMASGVSGPDGGRLHAYFQKMAVPASPYQGITYPQFISEAEEPVGANVEAMNPGSVPINVMDFYKSTPGLNDAWVTWDFHLYGNDGDAITHMTGADGNGWFGDGGPGFYRITLQVDSKHGSSSGYVCRLSSVAIHFPGADWL